LSCHSAVDEKPGPAYDGVESFIFSANSQRVAYIAKLGGKQLAVVDGKPGSDYDAIASIAFSSDSQHVIYTATQGGKQIVVLDGKPKSAIDAMLKGSRLVFDSPTALHTLARRENTIYRVKMTIAHKL